MITDSDTIAAIATPAGRGGIGIVKISGQGAFTIVKAVFRPLKKRRDEAKEQSRQDSGVQDFKFQTHRLYYGHIIDPKNNSLLDEVLISAMKAPNTYTREDVVEINAHGGAVAIHAILELVLSKGARLAEPGEFTRRAFLNGRIDLTQAEAVIDVINARTQKNLELAAAQISGKLKDRVAQSRSSLVGILTQVEAAIDFPDEEIDFLAESDVARRVQSAQRQLEALLQDARQGRLLRDGIVMAIIGRGPPGRSCSQR